MKEQEERAGDLVHKVHVVDLVAVEENYVGVGGREGEEMEDDDACVEEEGESRGGDGEIALK